MGYHAHVRVVNKVEYGTSFGINNEPETLLEEIELLEDDSKLEIIKWKSEKDFDMELFYDDFVEAMNTVYKEERHGKHLKTLLKEAESSEDCKNNGYIRIDWF